VFSLVEDNEGAMPILVNDWQPTASLDILKQRAHLHGSIRQFFAQRNVLEVDTPLLSHGTVTDVHLQPFSSVFSCSSSGRPQTLYLQTSPEYAMKRLLSAYGEPIYQLGKAFRHEGSGRWHNPEFTMLEWYRPGFDHNDLMQEVADLLKFTLGIEGTDSYSYQQLFITHVGLDPLMASQADIADAMEVNHIDVSSDYPIDRDGMLQLLFSYIVEPNIGQQQPCFVHSFPASQASLARLNDEDPRVADRFEVYYQGAELANGFHELQDGKEQRIRFEHDNRLRQTFRLDPAPVDERLLAALDYGLPECAGVAVGVDRLLMLKVGAKHIHDVIPFAIERA
jgi:lysyl-tRNA synthetase class 2